MGVSELFCSWKNKYTEKVSASELLVDQVL